MALAIPDMHFLLAVTPSGTLAHMILLNRSQLVGNHFRIFLGFTIAVALCIAPPAATARRQKTQHNIEAADLAKRIHTLVNAERRKQRLTVLAWSNDLKQIAEKHSQDMDQKNYLDHNSPDGKGFPERYRRDGYSCELRVGNVIFTGAENIALSHLYNSMIKEDGVSYYNWNSAQEIAQRTVSGWMNSPGHRKNILAPYWRQEGVGIKIEKKPGNKIYITQNFC